jgi:hypothetical protein
MSEKPDRIPAQRPGESVDEWFARLNRAQQEELDGCLWELKQLEYAFQQDQQAVWEEAQQAKAPRILELLRAHVPAERWPEVEEFLSSRYGRDCLGEILTPTRNPGSNAVARDRTVDGSGWPF